MLDTKVVIKLSSGKEIALTLEEYTELWSGMANIIWVQAQETTPGPQIVFTTGSKYTDVAEKRLYSGVNIDRAYAPGTVSKNNFSRLA